MVEDFFAWVKEQLSQCTVPPKSKTGQGLQYLVNQELYLKVFLTDGDVPIDNSASERSIRTFCIGKKNRTAETLRCEWKDKSGRTG